MTCDIHCLPADYTVTQEAVRVSVPVTEGAGPLAVSPRITQSNHGQFLAVEQVEYSCCRQVDLAYGSYRVGVAFH